MTDFASAAAKAATVPFPSPSIDASFRPAKALIGWMEPEQAHEVLALGLRKSLTHSPTLYGRAPEPTRDRFRGPGWASARGGATSGPVRKFRCVPGRLQTVA